MAHLHHPAEVAVIFKGKWQVEEKCVRHPLIFLSIKKPQSTCAYVLGPECLRLLAPESRTLKPTLPTPLSGMA